MQNLTDQIKNNALDGKITLQKAIAIIAPIDIERQETVELLLVLEKQVGQYYGEQIKILLAKMEGKKFNSVEYHYEKPVGDQ